MPSSSLHDAIVDRLMDDRAQPWDVATDIREAFLHALSIEDGSGRDRDPIRVAQLRAIANRIDPGRIT